MDKTAIEEALGTLDPWMLAIAMENGADPNSVISGTADRPLFAMLLAGRPDLARILLEYGANPRASDKSGKLFAVDFARHRARHSNDRKSADAILSESVSLLSEYGADTQRDTPFWFLNVKI